MTGQSERDALILVSLLAKHWRYCDKKNCCHRKDFNFKTIDKLYKILINKYSQNMRLRVDWIYFQYGGQDAKRYIKTMKKFIRLLMNSNGTLIC